MVAGLERHVGGRAAGPIACVPERDHLRVRSAPERSRRAFADDEAVAHQDASDGGPRRRLPPSRDGERERPVHRVIVTHRASSPAAGLAPNFEGVFVQSFLVNVPRCEIVTRFNFAQAPPSRSESGLIRRWCTPQESAQAPHA